MPLLDYLRAQGVVALEPAAPLTGLERLLVEYGEWMLGERGLAAATVRARVCLARRFLAQRTCSVDGLGVERLTGADVTGFLLRECARVTHVELVPPQTEPHYTLPVIGRSRAAQLRARSACLDLPSAPVADQGALKLVLEPIYEADFKPCSYGFRPKRRAHRRSAGRGASSRWPPGRSRCHCRL
jgi:hypothetical protein